MQPVNTSEVIQKTFQDIEGSLDNWLEEEHLYLPRARKDKLVLLLARVSSEEGYDSKDETMRLLRNLGGGQYDPDDMDSVEIEIQRILGHTSFLGRHREKVIVIGIMMFSAFILFLMNLNMTSIAIGVSGISKQQAQSVTYISDSQHEVIDQLMMEIVEINQQTDGIAVSKEKIVKILLVPMGVVNTREMPVERFSEVQQILNNIIIKHEKKQRNISPQP